MNAFEYGFYSEMEKTASVARPAYSAAKGALLGSLLAGGGLMAGHGIEEKLLDEKHLKMITDYIANMKEMFGKDFGTGILGKGMIEKKQQEASKLFAPLYQALEQKYETAKTPVIAGSAGGLGLLAGLRRAAKDSRENKAEPVALPKASVVDKIKSMLAKKK